MLINEYLKHHSSTKLMIVTKNQSIKDIKELITSGHKLFGENKVQEANLKYQTINFPEDLELHLIGPL